MKHIFFTLALSAIISSTSFSAVEVDIPQLSQIQSGNIEETGSAEDFEFSKTEILDEVSLKSSISSELDDYGVLRFTVDAPKSKSGRSPMKGADLFEKMMKHHGSRVKGIAGVWVYGTNLQMFRSALEKNDDFSSSTLRASYFAAATQTWTGMQGEKYGFTKVSSIEVTRNVYSETGEQFIITYIATAASEIISAKTCDEVPLFPIPAEYLIGGEVSGVNVLFEK